MRYTPRQIDSQFRETPDERSERLTRKRQPRQHIPAAFINSIAEEGTKAEAIEYLQKQWNETCALRAALQQIIDEAESDDGLSAWDGAEIARKALGL